MVAGGLRGGRVDPRLRRAHFGVSVRCRLAHRLVDMTDTIVNATGITLTDKAVAKAAALLAAENRDDLALRIAVQPGGCSGLRYQLMFDDRQLDGDLTHEYDGVTLVVDRMSAPYLGGATIDFSDTIEAQGFTIDNPNAQSSCACGDSFH